MKTKTTKLVWTSLMVHIHRASDKVLKYINDQKLVEVLQTYIPIEPNNIANLAKDLVIRNPDQVTIYKLLLYGQIRDALREANLCFQEDTVKIWAEKAKTTQHQ